MATVDETYFTCTCESCDSREEMGDYEIFFDIETDDWKTDKLSPCNLWHPIPLPIIRPLIIRTESNDNGA